MSSYLLSLSFHRPVETTEPGTCAPQEVRTVSIQYPNQAAGHSTVRLTGQSTTNTCNPMSRGIRTMQEPASPTAYTINIYAGDADDVMVDIVEESTRSKLR